jgi:hypothetical protein
VASNALVRFDAWVDANIPAELQVQTKAMGVALYNEGARENIAHARKHFQAVAANAQETLDRRRVATDTDGILASMLADHGAESSWWVEGIDLIVTD